MTKNVRALLGRLAAAFVVAILVLAGNVLSGSASPVGALGVVPMAGGTTATGGSGLYRDQITWIQWGDTAGETVLASSTSTKTVTSTRQFGGSTLAVTCTISGLYHKQNLESGANKQPGTRKVSSLLRHVLSCALYEGLLRGLVDPGDGGQFRWLGSTVAEAFGVSGVGGVEGLLPLGADLGRGAEVH